MHRNKARLLVAHYRGAAAKCTAVVNSVLASQSTMFDQSRIDELSARIRELVAASPARDIEKNLRAMLAAAFARLDLVTRHEYDVQTEVLARARAQIDQLEARLAELERKLDGR